MVTIVSYNHIAQGKYENYPCSVPHAHAHTSPGWSEALTMHCASNVQIRSTLSHAATCLAHTAITPAGMKVDLIPDMLVSSSNTPAKSKLWTGPYQVATPTMASAKYVVTGGTTSLVITLDAPATKGTLLCSGILQVGAHKLVYSAAASCMCL